jgi:hypothetical protein
LVPLTLSESVALKRSPILLVFVQTFEPDARVSDVPDEIVPVDGAGAGAGAEGVGCGAGWLAGGVVRGGLVRGREGADAGGEAGTSFNCGCVAVSAGTTVTSRAVSAESTAAVSASRPEQAKTAPSTRGKTARK